MNPKLQWAFSQAISAQSLNLIGRIQMDNQDIENLITGITCLENFRKKTGINPLDNYGYRELLQIIEMRQILPSIEKIPGRRGADAKALSEGYENIEFKSSGFDREPNFKNWIPAMFDMSKVTSEKKLYEFQGFGHSLFKRGQTLPVASYWIGKEHIKKIHPLIDKKVKEYNVLKESKESLREAIYIDLNEMMQYVDKLDIIFFKDGQRVTHKEFECLN